MEGALALLDRAQAGKQEHRTGRVEECIESWEARICLAGRALVEVDQPNEESHRSAADGGVDQDELAWRELDRIAGAHLYSVAFSSWLRMAEAS